VRKRPTIPSRQRGFARKRGSLWLAVWRDQGRERSRGGFDTKTAALDYANAKADEAVAHAAAIRFGDRLPKPVSNIATVTDLVDAFLARHRVDAATKRKLRAQLKHAKDQFGGRRIETLQPIELDVWRSTLPALSAHYMFRAFRQVLGYAVAMGLLDQNPTSRTKNTRMSADRRPIHPFESWEQVEAIGVEMNPRFAAIATVLVGTGLRPEELFGLERRDVDLDAGVLSVERVYSNGTVKEPTKSSRQRRRVPLRAHVISALKSHPPRLDTPLVFPAARGGHVDIEKFRSREWAPALRAADVAHRRIYDCRHTFASWAIAGGLQLFYLARIMGTSVQMIDQTYGRAPAARQRGVPARAARRLRQPLGGGLSGRKRAAPVSRRAAHESSPTCCNKRDTTRKRAAKRVDRCE
jgi:integrase